MPLTIKDICGVVHFVSKTYYLQLPGEDPDIRPTLCCDKLLKFRAHEFYFRTKRKSSVITCMACLSAPTEDIP